jgi:hypothetical protein
MGNSQSTYGPPKQLSVAGRRSAKASRIDLHRSPSLRSDSTDVSSILTITDKSKETIAYAPNTKVDNEESTIAYQAFLKVFPEYQLTWILDTLRRTDFARLDRTGETYVDYMGGALYPESLIRVHAGFLNNNVLGNTHSVSNR